MVDELLYNGIPVYMNPPNDGERIFLYDAEAEVRGVYNGMTMDEVLEKIGFSEIGKKYIYDLQDYTTVTFNVFEKNVDINVTTNEEWPYEKDIIIWYPLDETQNYDNAYLVLGFNDEKLDLIEVHTTIIN